MKGVLVFLLLAALAMLGACSNSASASGEREGSARKSLLDSFDLASM
jgi:hypothetical protein